jgi:hypothetical protein
MSKPLDLRQYVGQKGEFVYDSAGNILMGQGNTPPTDGTAGYSVGAIWFDLNAAAGSQWLRNDGTAASCDFNVTNGGIDLSLLTATAAELNAAVGDGDEVVTATNVIAATENGRTYYLNAAGGFTSTLPAPALGLRFRFIVKTAPTTSYVITTTSGADILYGMMLERAGTAGVAGAGRDTFNFVANQSIIGDWVEFYSDGVNYYYHGMVDVAAGNTVAAT